MGRKGLSLMEIIISMVILALVVAGLSAALVSGNKFIHHSRYRMAGAEIGKIALDPIQRYVRQDTWGTNPLGTNGSIAGITVAPYTISYEDVTALTPSTIKKVKATLTWSE